MAKTPPIYSDDSIVNGSDVLVFIWNEAKSKYEMVANSTSSQITSSADAKDRVTKDTGKWKKKRVTGLTVQIKCDALVGMQDPEGKTGYNKLMEAHRAGTPVYIKYGTSKEGDTYESGYFIISSIDKTDAAQEDSTFSATFDNTGEVTTDVNEAQSS